MRKIITISFLTVYLLGNTEIGQLANLPKLISHYNLHHQLNTSVGFTDFVAMHYFGDDGISTDDQDDDQLPFRQLHKPFSAVTFVVPAFASFNSNSAFIEPEKLLFDENKTPVPGYSALPIRPPESSI